MRHPLRSVVAAAWSVTLITVSLVLASVPVGAAPPAGNSLSKVEKKVLDQLAAAKETTFWVVLKDQADLSAAGKTRDWNARGQLVVDKLRATADTSQAGLRGLLQSRSVKFEAFWVVNTIRVTAGQSLLNEIAARPEVTAIRADATYQIPDPLPGKNEPGIQTVEWNIARINADKAWSTFNVRGEGITVANIDTGVQWDHPALKTQYRGLKADGTVDHNYNWVDPSKICGNPSLVPCDNVNHGTHTMGTMVGDDRNPDAAKRNQIGVAPMAKWIAAKGCETFGCSLNALLASGQWVLAPTDLAGKNPRPDLRPHAVNNSWGGGPGSTDPFYRETVQKWVAAGIFPAFANGNAGFFGCGGAAPPGNYPESYGVGAFDISNNIAGFSSLGPAPAALGGGIKPQVAAPGVNVRSSVPGGRYDNFSGTSMATPHVAATVALAWSALPALKGDIAQTRALLDDTAITTSDLKCGGTPDNNNVWGHGRLDAFAAVDMARSPQGTLQGTVTAASGGAPINGATVKIEGPSARMRTTAADGTYNARLKVGTYTVTVSALGFLTETDTLDILEGETTTANFALATAPSVQGRVTDANDRKPVSATVRALQGTTVVASTATDSTGFYRMFLDFGDFTIEAASRHYVTEAVDVSLVTATPVTQDFALTTGIAELSARNLEVIIPAGQTRTRSLTLSNTGSADLKFEIKESGGGKVTTASSLGLTLNPDYDPNARTAEGLFREGNPPGWSITAPGRIIKQWPATDLTLGWGIGLADKVWISNVIGMTANHEFTVDGVKTGRNWPTPWAGFWAADMAYVPSRNLMCQVAVGADNGIYCWNPNTGVVVDSIRGSFDWSRTSQRGLAYRPDDDSFYIGGWNEGIVYHIQGLSHSDKGAVIGKCNPADRAISGLAWNPAARIVWEATNSPTDTIYQLNPETCAVMGTLAHPVTGGFRGAGLEMDEATGNLWIISQGQRGTPSTVSLVESGVPTFNKIPWLKETPASGSVPAGGEQVIQLALDSTGLEAGLYSGSLFFEVDAGRQSIVRVPINLIVPAYQQGANVAGELAYTDQLGDAWAADQAWDVDGWGYFDEGTVMTTTANISGTDDPALYRKARAAPIAYRFDALPPGKYQVDLRFAEITDIGPNTRLFDVIIGNDLVLPAHDIVFAAGTFAADDYTFFTRVTDGRLNVRLVPRTGFRDPIISAVRVTHRPDR